jgi:hypothetical protein
VYKKLVKRRLQVVFRPTSQAQGFEPRQREMSPAQPNQIFFFWYVHSMVNADRVRPMLPVTMIFRIKDLI